MAKVDVVGLPNALQNLARVAASVNTPAAKKVYIEAGWRVAVWARYYAPFDSSRGKKGAHLRDSILVTPGPLLWTDVLVTVRYKRPGAPHAHLIEFGTSKFGGHPFMRPAVATAAKEVEAILRKGLLQVIAAAPR